MWPAPTAEDWKLPCLIEWQRTFDDALRVAKETGKPILLCVNMDGEIASEHFAGVRYRRPETAALYSPYVCVIASVYRHTPRDYDEQGRRIPCPRFGTVTCGEHIAIEPILFERFFDGKRIAPRHIAIELDSQKTYDVYYSWDTKTVFTALTYGVANRPAPNPLAHDDMPMVDRVASADAVDRTAVEVAYQQGGQEVRRELLEATLTHHDVEQIDLLRLAIFGFDVELARFARQALAQLDSEAAVDLIAEALKLPMDAAEREALIAAAVRLGEKYPRARTLAAVHQGLAVSSKRIDVQAWSIPSGTESNESARGEYDRAAGLESRVEVALARPTDEDARLDLAESFLLRAEDPSLERRFARVTFEDARKAALEAAQLGAKGWRLEALLAVTSNALGDREGALTHAVAAIEGGMPPPSSTAEDAGGRNAVTVLALYAQARQRAIAKAYREKAAWPAEWLSDIHAAYAVLAHHPLGTDENVAAHYDFLRWLGATPRAVAVLDEGLARFPESWILHDRLRARVLWEKGADGLEATYAEMLAKPDAAPNLEWFAGYAALVAAEHYRRAGNVEAALTSYDHAIAHYQSGVEKNPDSVESANHYVAIALAGRARIALERGEFERATSEILAAFEKRPQSAATADGLNITPVETAKMLHSQLVQDSRQDLASKVQAGLDALDPKLLELPAYEREGELTQPRRRRTQ
jgi:tetratricopeptide (TPR) repeat protein